MALNENAMPVITGSTYSDGQLKADTVFQPELDYFKGHFPDFVILPGVALLKITIELLSQYEQLGDVQEVSKLKFMHFVKPGDELELSAQINLDTKRIKFHWSNKIRAYASGQLQF